MRHENIQEQISLFMDNDLPKEAHRELFMHLGECETCREFFAETKKIHDAAKTLEYDTVPEALDSKFDVLGMNESSAQFRERTMTISIPSALFTVGAVIMMTIFIYVIGSFQEKSLLSQYQKTMSYTGQLRANSSSSN